MITTRVRIYLVIVLGIVFGYNVLTLFMEVSRSREPKIGLKYVERLWNITAKEQQYSYPITVEMNERKWYRVGFLVSSNTSAELDITLVSLLGGEQTIGTVVTSGGVGEEYQEKVFFAVIPSAAEIRFSLPKQESGEIPRDAGIEISSVTISQLDIANDKDRASLFGTSVGVFSTSLQEVLLERKAGFWRNEYSGEFVAQDDFIESVNVKSFLMETGSSGGWLEIRRKTCSTCEGMGEVLRREFVSSQELRKESQTGMPYVIRFPVWLNREKVYEVVFHGVDDWRQGRLYDLFAIQRLVTFDMKKSIALVTGRPSDTQEKFLLRGARVEDLGRRIQYSYHSDGSVYDYLNLWRTEGKVWFDEKTRQVVGQQKLGTNFTYKFSVGGPFHSFSFRAEQRESRKQEVFLEYSLDGTLWHEVPFLMDGGKGWFRFLLSGKDDQDTVYVRASYSGEERKTGVFGLDQVSVIAQLKE